MGFNWQILGYPNLQAFINAAYRDEASHLDMFVRFIQANKLQGFLKDHDWKNFAKRYNGPNYAINSYDRKMGAAWEKYNKASKSSKSSKASK